MVKRVSLISLRKSASSAVKIPVQNDSIEKKEESNIVAPTDDIEEVKKRKRVKRVRKDSSSSDKKIEDSDDIETKLQKKDSSGLKDSNKQAPIKELNHETSDVNSLCNDKTVYIEGLPYDATDADILSFFESCGQIQSVRLPKWHDSGRLRGYGHVQFMSTESVKKAMDLDGCDMKGRYIKVDRPQTPRALSSADKSNGNVVRPAGCRSVFVKNIPYDTSEAEVTETFKVCGPITNVRLAVWGNTKQLKGFGYVDFKREDSAEIAVKKSGILSLKGRPVIIDFETGAPKKSFRKPDGKVWTKSDSEFNKKKVHK